MPKKSGAKEIIVEELKKNELSKNELLKIVKYKAKLASKNSTKKTVDKFLYELLKEGTVAVVGYDLGVIDEKVGEMVKEGVIIRNVPAEGMVFALIKFGPTYIIDLINSVLNNNLKKDNEDSNKLRAYFINKTRELEDEFNREWNTDLKEVKYRKMEFHEMLWIEVIKDINNQIKDKPAYELITPSYKEIKQYMENNKEIYREKTQDITGKYENKLLWYLEDEEPDIIKVKTIKLLLNNHIFKVGKMTEEDFLIRTGLYKNKPDSQPVKVINDIFEQTMLYINSRPIEEKDHLIYRLAYSLGPGKISTTRFRNLRDEILEKASKSYLDEVTEVIEREIRKEKIQRKY